MRSYGIFLGFAAIAAAQSIDTAAVSNAPPPPATIVPWGAGSALVSYDSNAVSSATYNSVLSSLQSSSSKRSLIARNSPGPCDNLTVGYGPSPSPDTPAAFANYSAFSNAANSAITPNGYVNAFTNLNGASSLSAYLGYDTLQSYNVSGCASKCTSISGCIAFNIYFERDPTQLPADSCPNPASTTNIKCSYWGAPLGPETATNTGQIATNFTIVNAGSNGYNAQTVSNVPGYTGSFLGSMAINAPTSCNSYITYKLFNGGQPFDPNRCAPACKAETDYNAQYLNSQAVCRFFDTYVLSKNGVPQGQYCALYTASWDNSYATNTGYTSGNDSYTISYSYSYSNATDSRLDSCTCGIGSVCNTGNTTTSTTSMATISTTTTSSLSMTTTPTTTTTTTTTATFLTTMPTTTATTTTTMTTAASTTAASTTASTAISTTTKTSSSTSSTSSTTSSTTTTKSTTTSTTTSTTMTTSTKTTTTTSATATPTGPCFRVKIKGPSYCNGAYIGLDSTGAFSYSASSPATFWLDNTSTIRTKDMRFGKCPNAKTSSKNGPVSFGQSADPAAVLCTGSGNNVSCQVSGQSITSLWTGSGQGTVVLGNQPSSGKWDQISVTVEFCSCS